MQFDEKTKRKLRENLQQKLSLLKEYGIYENGKRVSLDKEILQELLFEQCYTDSGIVLVLVFNNEELRKLDLEDIDFTDVYLCGQDLSYTNADINPQKVYGKNLNCANLEGVDLTGKDFTGVSIMRTNLTDTNAFIDFEKVANFDEAILTGCKVADDMEQPVMCLTL